jgi:hypothetical protein
MTQSYRNASHYARDYGKGNREIIPAFFRALPRNFGARCETMTPR